jgi:hypothetical protein
VDVEDLVYLGFSLTIIYQTVTFAQRVKNQPEEKMAHKVHIEIGSKNENGSYSRGLYFDFEVTGRTTVKGILTQAERHSREICEEKKRTFVECMIIGLE